MSSRIVVLGLLCVARSVLAQRTVSLGADLDVTVRDGNKFQWQPTVNYSDRYSDRIAGNGGPFDKTAKVLMRFDVSSLPSGTVDSATLQLSVGNTSPATIQLYELGRPFVASEATWNRASSLVSWQSPGATGAGDRSVQAGSFVANSAGLNSVALSPTLVQVWRDTPAANTGLLLESPAMSDALEFSSVRSQLSTRPRLVVVVAGTTFTFQQGVAGYTGMTDTTIASGADPRTVSWNRGSLEVDGFPGSNVDHNHASALIRFPVAGAMPAWSTVLGATLRLRGVFAESASRQPLYEARVPWNEQATWFLRDGVTAWGTSGAAAVPGDRGASAIGALPPGDGGSATFVPFNANGVALVQRWLEQPDANFGVIAQDLDAGDLFGCQERESGNGPVLDVSYVESKIDCAVGCSAPGQCVITFTRTQPDGGALTPSPAAFVTTAAADQGALSDGGRVAFVDGGVSTSLRWAGTPGTMFEVQSEPPDNRVLFHCFNLRSQGSAGGGGGAAGGGSGTGGGAPGGGAGGGGGAAGGGSGIGGGAPGGSGGAGGGAAGGGSGGGGGGGAHLSTVDYGVGCGCAGGLGLALPILGLLVLRRAARRRPAR